jgi:hypothetical protein
VLTEEEVVRFVERTAWSMDAMCSGWREHIVLARIEEGMRVFVPSGEEIALAMEAWRIVIAKGAKI